MLSFKTLFTALAIFGLFLGILSSLSYDLLLIISNPTSGETWKYVVKDMAKMVSNSQQEISNSIREFKDANESYKNYLIARILAGSLVTLFLIYIFYRGIKFFFESPKPTDKIVIILISVLIVWFIGVLASYILGEINWMPFSGWVDLIKNKDVLVDYLLQRFKPSG